MPCVAAEHRQRQQQRPANAAVGVRERGSEWQLSNLDPKSWKEQRKIYEKIKTEFDKSETRHTHTHKEGMTYKAQRGNCAATQDQQQLQESSRDRERERGAQWSQFVCLICIMPVELPRDKIKRKLQINEK